MKRTMAVFGLVLAFAASTRMEAAEWPPEKSESAERGIIEAQRLYPGRKLEKFTHGVRKEWGYATTQQDSFLVLHPQQARPKAPLYVVLHGAGGNYLQSLTSAGVGNSLFRSPDDFFALHLDGSANKGDSWWGSDKHRGPEVGPTEKRVIDTVKWVVQQYKIDENRVYLCGISMGGSGTLGIGMRHGDLFAAIKACVPAGVAHVSSRMYFPPQTVPAGTTLPDPPIAIAYSAQNDSWSRGQAPFVKAMNERKYALFMYWGPFGHTGHDVAILKVNDLINSFDWLSVKKNEAYPVFTNATTNDPLPWPDQLADTKSGQINAFFRWKNLRDTPQAMEILLVLVKPSELKTAFTIPAEATADVTLRRLQTLKIAPGETVRWAFGAASGEVKADAAGCVTVPRLKITADGATLSVRKIAGPEAVKTPSKAGRTP